MRIVPLLLGCVLGLGAVASARAEPDCVALVPALWPEDQEAARLVRASSSRCAVAGARVPGEAWITVVAEQDTLVALAREGRTIARGRFDPVAIDPPWNPMVEITPETLLGSEVEVVRVTYGNSYLSTGRSTSTESITILVRRGDALVPVFASLTSAAHSEEVACPRGRRRPPCRMSWSRRWTIEAAAARPGVMPALVVRDGRTRQVVSRHRWQRGAYQPPVFDRTPPLGPG